ncbi:MAG: amidohydrolase family protein, partial [Chloroflexota bacterium]
CMVADVTLARRFRELGIVPVLQPDIHRLGDGYIAALGMERASQVIPMQLFDTMNIQVAFSSDCPVIPCNPLHVIRSAMERQTPAGIVLGPEHRVSALQALQRYTVGGACATRTEAHKGRLRTGMFADFTVLSADPAMTSPEDFQQIRVTRTVTGGEVRYQA